MICLFTRCPEFIKNGVWPYIELKIYRVIRPIAEYTKSVCIQIASLCELRLYCSILYSIIVRFFKIHFFILFRVTLYTHIGCMTVKKKKNRIPMSLRPRVVNYTGIDALYNNTYNLVASEYFVCFVDLMRNSSRGARCSTLYGVLLWRIPPEYVVVVRGR